MIFIMKIGWERNRVTIFFVELTTNSAHTSEWVTGSLRYNKAYSNYCIC